MGQNKDKPILSTSFGYDAQISNWVKVETVINGTQALRDAADDYLPQYAGESNVNYKNRVKRSFLKNYFLKTLNMLVGHPFSKPIQKEEWAPEFDEFWEDVDLMGNNLDIFAKKVFTMAIAKGLVYILIDFPTAPENLDDEGNQVPITKEDEERLNLRPYFNVLNPENVFFIQSDVVDGVEVPVHVRIREDAYELGSDGFSQVVRNRIRVLRPGSWELYEKDNKNNWKLVGGGETSLNEIPLTVFYLDKLGFAHSRTPMNDLADLNIAHWQSMSDQRNILTVARFPILTGVGIAKEEADNVIVGPFNMLSTNQPDGKFAYLEHKGAAIEAGRKDIEDLERSLETIIIDFLSKKPGNRTATGDAIDSAKSQSLLQTWALQFQDFLETSMVFVSKWKEIEPDTNGNIKISTEFGIIGDAEDLKALQESRKLGDISRKALLTEYKRRNILNEEYDIEEDAEQIIEEGIPRVELDDPNLDEENDDGTNEDDLLPTDDDSGQ